MGAFPCGAWTILAGPSLSTTADRGVTRCANCLEPGADHDGAAAAAPSRRISGCALRARTHVITHGCHQPSPRRTALARRLLKGRPSKATPGRTAPSVPALGRVLDSTHLLARTASFLGSFLGLNILTSSRDGPARTCQQCGARLASASGAPRRFVRTPNGAADPRW
jgi:hypothetical protein